MQIQILREKQSGLRLAWEKLYKQIVYSLVVDNADSDAATHKAEDFLLELEELDNNWRRSQLLVNNEIQELNDESLNIEEERMETIWIWIVYGKLADLIRISELEWSRRRR